MGKRDTDTSESFDFLAGTSVGYYIDIIKKNPKGNQESNLALLHQYREGDDTAYELLIKTNLGLVIKTVKQYQQYCESFELIDLIHEGIIGLIKAIEIYDFNYNKALSTLATICIQNQIRTCLSTSDKQIKRGPGYNSLVNKYNAIMNERIANGEEIPSNAEFCKLLGTTEKTLLIIKEDYKLNVKSLNDKVNDDEVTEVGDFVEDKTNWSENYINQMRDKSLLLSLKKRFGAYKYYVLYNRIFNEEKVTDESIANIFGIGKNAVSLMEIRIREELKNAITTGGIDVLSTEYNERASVKPLDPEEIISYLFYRDSLTKEEKQLYKLIVSKEYIYDERLFAKIMDVTEEKFNRILNSLKRKINNNDESLKKAYECFRSEIIKKYKTKLLAIDLDTNLDDIETNIKYVANFWNDISYEEVLRIINKNNIKFSKSVSMLISKYFNSPSNDNGYKLSVKKAEREVNSFLFGFNKKNVEVIDGLYDFLEANRQSFSDEEYYYLLMAVFHKITKRDFETRFPDSKCHGHIHDLMYKLESMYFNISKYNDYNFTKEKYESIRDKVLDRLSVDKIDILDKFYGVNQEPMSIKEIADKNGMSYEKTKILINSARLTAVSIYLKRKRSKDIKAENYIPYILDEEFDLPDLTRTIMHEFLIDGLTYDEIVAKHKNDVDSKSKIDKTRVSTIILYGIEKIDFYRFGIAKMDNKFTENEINAAYNSNTFNDNERKVIEKKLAGKTCEEISTELGLKFDKVKKILDRFYKKCKDIKVEKVEVDIRDVENEFTCHISERVLTDRECLLLSEVYGISCAVNPSGIKYGKDKFIERHKEYTLDFKKIENNALRSIKLKKAGLKHGPIAYMDRKELRKSLLDPRIPIDEKSRELLYYSFELNGYPYKSVKELATMCGCQTSKLTEKMKKVFVTIFKYENDELDSNISYEYDVEPYLKFFAKSDQAFLTALYRDNLTYKEVAKKNEITFNQVERLSIRLETYLYDLWDKKVNGFDFDYFWAHVDDDDVPFYGNKEQAKRFFYLYFEKRMSIQDIVNALHLECSPATVERTINNLMLAVLKKREGIKKINTYSYDDVKEYYDRCVESMSNSKKATYNMYFENAERLKDNSMSSPNIYSDIFLDLIKDKKDDVFEIGKASREEVIQIIQSYKHLLTKTTISTLINEYSIEQRELMSGSEKMKVLRFLSTLDSKDKILALKQSA